MPNSDALESELKRLRKGRGVLADDLHERVGPEVARLCEVVGSDSAAVVRRKVIAWLTDLTMRLPEDLRLIARVALALHEETRHRFLNERLQWAGERLHRDARTIRRRADEALRRLAEAAQTPTTGLAEWVPGDDCAPEGWYIESARTFLRLDQQAPELTIERMIVATIGNLKEVVNNVTFPRRRDGVRPKYTLAAEPVYGCSLIRERRLSESYFSLTFGLPGSLAVGEKHEYAFRASVPEDQPIASQYIYQPFRRCDLFTLRVRFNREALPQKVWLLKAAPLRVIDDPRSREETIDIDRYGEVSVQFWRPKPGLGYGVEWEP